MIRILTGIIFLTAASVTMAQSNRIDIVRHDAPELAHLGLYDVGVRTLNLTDSNRPDVLNTEVGGDTVYYDRKLTVEIWYPAQLADGQTPGGVYETATRNLAVTATLKGRAVRDATSLRSIGAVPLVIISHGYPGNRYLMSHLAENLASKGYVVASIDHPGSTYTDQLAIASTLYNRPLDQLFVIDQVALLSGDSDNFLAGMVDTENTGIVGYSMGGYGLIINIGGGYSEALVNHDVAPPNGLARRHAATNADYRQQLDSRIKAAFAIAPWGMARSVWNPQDLRAIEVPTFYVAGSVDDTAGYEDGVRAIYENATQSDRYLLTYVNAGHNAGAPIPLPIELANHNDAQGSDHYTDPVWDNVRMNNIMDHFATAFFDYRLKGDLSRREYLDSTDPEADWKGFVRGTAHGLILEHLEPAE